MIQLLLPTLGFLLMLLMPVSRAAHQADGQDHEPPIDSRVAVVIDFGGGVSRNYCVSFSEPHISGYEALQRTGLVASSEMQTGGAAVCKVGDSGCPSDDCFCACRGGADCVYWSYWHRVDGAWQYSVAGSSLYQVSDGAVDGWVWGLGSVAEASPPPDVTFEEVCSVKANLVHSPPVSTTPAQLPLSWIQYGVFAALLLLLGAIALAARRRAARRGTE